MFNRGAGKQRLLTPIRLVKSTWTVLRVYRYYTGGILILDYLQSSVGRRKYRKSGRKESKKKKYIYFFLLKTFDLNISAISPIIA